MRQWFVARTKTGQETRAGISVAACGFSTFLPVQMTQRTHAGKRENVSRPLFPRYLFVAFDPTQKAYGVINNCRGVASRGLMVTASGEPIKVPDDVIAQIRVREAAMLAKAGEVTTGYEPGETFQLPCGKGLLTYRYMGEENGKVWALVEMFGKGHPVELEFSQVPPKKEFDAIAC